MSLQRDSRATLQLSLPFLLTFRQRTKPGRPQVELPSACLTSFWQALGKPVLPSSFAKLFTMGFQHLPQSRFFANEAQSHPASTAARTSATMLGLVHFDSVHLYFALAGPALHASSTIVAPTTSDVSLGMPPPLAMSSSLKWPCRTAGTPAWISPAGR
jgi:hypothetical protein